MYHNRSQNKIVDLLGETLKKKIIPEIKDTKYFTLMLDSTEDIDHKDQVYQILRYAHIDKNRNAEIKETFLRFLKSTKKMQKAW